jgi:hypothetical protein
MQVLLHQNKSIQMPNSRNKLRGTEASSLKIVRKTALTSFQKFFQTTMRIKQFIKRIPQTLKSSRIIIHTPPNCNSDPGFKRTFHKHFANIAKTGHNDSSSQTKKNRFVTLPKMM